jgi:hypothetical protein
MAKPSEADLLRAELAKRDAEIAQIHADRQAAEKAHLAALNAEMNKRLELENRHAAAIVARQARLAEQAAADAKAADEATAKVDPPA